nr:unnamed protein product [Callosobruchus chinensis]
MDKVWRQNDKFFMIFSQILGVLPQENICTNVSEIHFNWRSWKTIYTIFLIILSEFAVACCIIAWFKFGYAFEEVVAQVFFLASTLTLILHLRLAKHWPQLIASWCKMDKVMNVAYGYPPTLDRRLKIFTLLFMGLALIDGSLSAASRYTKLTGQLGERYNYTYYFNEAFPELFGVLMSQATLMWAYNDVFIILLSTPLALRFRQITERLEDAQKKVKPDSFWGEIREDYDRLSIICKQLDEHISYIVLLSFSLNIFLMLVQLYKCLQYVKGTIEKVYFVYSFIYIILKVVTVSLYAAWINDESLEPAIILNTVSSSRYNTEIRRLLVQISFDNIALTGCRMFKITRGIVLSKNNRLRASAVMVYVIPREKLPQADKQKQNDVEKAKNLHSAIKVFFNYSHVLGVLPQEHVGDMNKMKFQWRSFRTAYTLCMISAFSFSLGCSYLAWMTKRCTFDGIVDWTLALVSRFDSLSFNYQDEFTYDKYYNELFPEILLDERISYIILLTFSTNVFFILVQVYETVNCQSNLRISLRCLGQ